MKCRPHITCLLLTILEAAKTACSIHVAHTDTRLVSTQACTERSGGLEITTGRPLGVKADVLMAHLANQTVWQRDLLLLRVGLLGADPPGLWEDNLQA